MIFKRKGVRAPEKGEWCSIKDSVRLALAANNNKRKHMVEGDNFSVLHRFDSEKTIDSKGIFPEDVLYFLCKGNSFFMKDYVNIVPIYFQGDYRGVLLSKYWKRRGKKALNGYTIHKNNLTVISKEKRAYNIPKIFFNHLSNLRIGGVIKIDGIHEYE